VLVSVEAFLQGPMGLLLVRVCWSEVAGGKKRAASAVARVKMAAAAAHHCLSTTGAQLSLGLPAYL